MDGGEFEFFGGGLAGSVAALYSTTSASPPRKPTAYVEREDKTHRKRPSAPRGAAPHLLQTAQDRETGLVPQRHINHPMMRQRAHGRNRRALLSSSLGARAHKQTSVFAPIGAGLPLFAGVVPEGFPLGGEVAVAGRDAEEEGVVVFEEVGGDGGNGVGFWGGVHRC